MIQGNVLIPDQTENGQIRENRGIAKHEISIVDIDTHEIKGDNKKHLNKRDDKTPMNYKVGKKRSSDITESPMP